MNSYEKIRGLLMEAPRRIPRKGFSSVHQHDPRGKRDVGMRRSYAARQDHTYVEMLNRGLAMAQRKLDRGEGSQEAVDMWARRLKANQQANPGGAPQTKSQENQSTEINMDGYERIYEMFINEVAGGTPSHKAPGHEKRMKDHQKRADAAEDAQQQTDEFVKGDTVKKRRGKG